MKIPVILVTGFLGSGKTTFLRHLAATHPDWHVAFLVNEYAETGEDSVTLAAEGIPSESIVGGSLFCECKAAEFVEVMRERVLSEHAAQPLNAVIIETSGIADPQAIGTLMNQHGLADYFTVQQIVTLVAPKRVLTLLDNLPVIEAQITTSDLIIVNKCDLVDDRKLNEVTAELQRRNPKARLVRCEQSKADFALQDLAPTLPEAELSTCESNPFTAEVVPLVTPLKPVQFLAWLDGLPLEVLRVKGRVETTEGWLRVEKTVDGQVVEPCDRSEQSQLVVIVPDEHEEDLPSLTAALRSPVA